MKKIALILVLACACASPNSTEIKFGREVRTFSYEDFEVEVIKSEINYFTEIFKPINIAITENHILVSDRATKKHLHIISKENSRYVGQLGDRGQGPNEFLSLSGFKRSFNDDQFIVY